MDYKIDSKMDGISNEPRNLIGLSELMLDENNPDIDLVELEKNIINGAKDIQAEEVDLAAQYKNEMQNLTKKFGISLSSDNDNAIQSEEPIKYDYGEYNLASNYSAPVFETKYTEPEIPTPIISTPYEDFSDYKFSDTTGYSATNNSQYKDNQLNNMTQEQEKRNHLRRAFNNISSRDKINMDNYDLAADREYEDKQMLLAEIDELRDDLTQVGIDISRIKDVDNNSTIDEIREVHRKLIYKNNSNNYSSFADELFILGAQAAEYMCDGEKIWFGHKPDLTGWTNTVRGKLRRMKYAKTRIVRKIVDEYKIPEWLQIGIEILPSAFTHSRHRKSAVRDSVVNDASYRDAIHNLNNMMK